MNCPQCSTEMVKARATSFGPEYDYCRSCKKELSELTIKIGIPKDYSRGIDAASYGDWANLTGGNWSQRTIEDQTFVTSNGVDLITSYSVQVANGHKIDYAEIWNAIETTMIHKYNMPRGTYFSIAVEKTIDSSALEQVIPKSYNVRVHTAITMPPLTMSVIFNGVAKIVAPNVAPGAAVTGGVNGIPVSSLNVPSGQGAPAPVKPLGSNNPYFSSITSPYGPHSTRGELNVGRYSILSGWLELAIHLLLQVHQRKAGKAQAVFLHPTLLAILDPGKVGNVRVDSVLVTYANATAINHIEIFS